MQVMILAPILLSMFNFCALVNSPSKNHATGSISVEVIDEAKLTGHEYLVEFSDTATDTMDNDNDWDLELDDLNQNGQMDIGEPNLDFYDLDEFPPVTTLYSVFDLTGIEEIIHPEDTLPVYLEHSFIYPGSVTITDISGDLINPENYTINYETGKICRDNNANVLVAGSYIFSSGKENYKKMINSLR